MIYVLRDLTTGEFFESDHVPFDDNVEVVYIEDEEESSPCEDCPHYPECDGLCAPCYDILTEEEF